MKRVITSALSVLILSKNYRTALLTKGFFLLIFLFSVSDSFAQRAKSYTTFEKSLNKTDRQKFITLTKDNLPSVDLKSNNNARSLSRSMQSGESNKPAGNVRVANVLSEDVDALNQLSSYYSTLEVVNIKFLSKDNKSSKIDLSMLKNASHLKYIIFIFEYNPCNSSFDDACFQNILSTVTGHEDLSAEILFELSIPQ